MASRTKNSARNIISGTVNKVVITLFPFITRTIIIRVLGAQYLGLNSLYTSILSVLSLAELGFGSAMVYSMYKPIANDDDTVVCALLNLYRKVYRSVGLVILILGLSITPFLTHFISGDYPQDINIYLLYLIYLFNTVLSYFLYAYKASVLIAVQRSDISTNIATILALVQGIIQILVLLTIRNYYLYVLAIPIGTAANNILQALYIRKKYPQYVPSGNLAKEKTRGIRKRVIALVGNKIGAIVTNSADSMVISAFLGLVPLAIYNNYYYIIAALNSFIMTIFVSITASVGHSMVKESVEKNYRDFKHILFLNNWIIMWCSTTFLCLCQNFMYLWVGKDLMYSNDLVILFAIYYYTWQMRRTAITFKDAGGLWWEDRFRPYIITALNVVLNIILVQYIGVAGVLLSTIIQQIVAIPWENMVLYKKYFYKPTKEFWSQTGKYVLSSLAICFCTYWVCSFMGTLSVTNLLLRGAVCVVLPNALYILLFHKNENFHYIVDLIRRSIQLAKNRIYKSV